MTDSSLWRPYFPQPISDSQLSKELIYWHESPFWTRTGWPWWFGTNSLFRAYVTTIPALNREFAQNHHAMVTLYTSLLHCICNTRQSIRLWKTRFIPYPSPPTRLIRRPSCCSSSCSSCRGTERTCARRDAPAPPRPCKEWIGIVLDLNFDILVGFNIWSPCRRG